MTVASTFVIGFLGQSSLKYLNAPTAFYNQPGVPKPAITVNGGQGNCIWVGSPPGNLGRILEIPVTDAAVRQTSEYFVNPAIATLAAWLGRMWPATTFVLKDMCEGESSRLDLASDTYDVQNATPRLWANTANIAAYKADVWGEVDLVVEVWTKNDEVADALRSFGAEFAPFYLGERQNGGAWSLGTANPDSVAFPGQPWHHVLWDDGAGSLSAKGRGLFARTTKWTFVPEMLNKQNEAAMRAFAADARVAGAFGQEPLGFFGNYQDGGHADLTDKDGDGQPLAIRALFPAIARAMGLTVRQPQDYRLVVAPDRKSAQIAVKLPNGGTLTTERMAQGRAFPSSPLSYQQQVTGVFIRRAGWTEAQMQPVYRLGQAGPAPRRGQVEGTVTLLDPGSGTGSAREGRILYVPHPDWPLQAGDAVYLNWNIKDLSPLVSQASVFFTSPQKPYLDTPVETLPALSDPAQKPNLRFNGIGLRPWMPAMPV